MNAHYRLKSLKLLMLGFFIVFFTSCAASQAYQRGKKAELVKDYETAVSEYKRALDRDPGNIDYQLQYQQARFGAAFDHFEKGRRAVDNGDFQTAKSEFQRAIELDPSHAFAQQELAKVNEILEKRSQNLPEPEHDLGELKQTLRTDPSVQAQLQPTVTGPITVRMTQDSRAAFETLAQLAGINVIFDPDFRPANIQVEVRDVDIYSALDILAMQTRTFWLPVNKNTILVSPDNQQKRRDYEQHVLKTLYLSNSVTSTEITEAITALRTLLNMRYIAQSTATNAIIVRDTADRVAIAEKIVEDIDKSKPEVLVEVTLLEVDRSQLQQLGISPPQSTTLQYAPPGATAGATDVNKNVRLTDLDGLNSSTFSVNIPDTVARFLATNAKSRLLQNPSVRATDGKQASLRIGSRVPFARGSFQPAFVGATGTPVVNFDFADVGVNVDLTPRVLLNREVSMTVAVVVSAQADDRDVGGGVRIPVFTNRSVQHEIRLKEGETNVLGGIISDREATSISGLPGVTKVPLLKYLFGQENRTRDETEIIIMLTPHIVRMPNISEANLRGLYIGSETNTRLRTSSATPSQPQSSATQPPGATPAGASVLPAAVLTPQAQVPQAELRQTNAVISFTPSPVTIAAGQQTSLNIAISGTNIFAVELTLSFDPSSISITQVREGGFLSNDGRTPALVQNIDTETGTAKIVVERPPGAPSISGSGSVFTLMLTAGTRKGESSIRVTDFRIRDAQQNMQVGKPVEVQVTLP